MERIKLTDNAQTAIAKLSEGNPGALSVCIAIFNQGATIDPDAGALGGFGPLLSLDTMGIYGPRIWMLYKDVCAEDLRVMLALMRARQLGLLAASGLLHGIDNRGAGIDIDAVVARVEERLPDFQKGDPQTTHG